MSGRYLLARYLVAHFWAGLAFALVVLLTPFLLFATAHELGDLGQGDYGLSAAFGQVLAAIPELARDLLPAAILLGAAGAGAWLARSGQLWVIRGVGLARGRLAAWILGAALLVAALDLLNSEFLVPAGARFSQQLEQLRQPERGAEFWLRNADEHVRLYWNPASTRARDLRIYQYAPDGRLRRMRQAESADFQQGQWRLREVQEWSLEPLAGGATGIRPRTLEEVRWELALLPSQLAWLSLDADQLPLRQLLDSSAVLADHGRPARFYHLAFWQRLLRIGLLPLLALAAFLLGAGVRPGGGLGKVLLAAVALSVLLLLGLQISAALVLLLGLHPLVTALPVLLTAALAVPAAKHVG